MFNWGVSHLVASWWYCSDVLILVFLSAFWFSFVDSAYIRARRSHVAILASLMCSSTNLSVRGAFSRSMPNQARVINSTPTIRNDKVRQTTCVLQRGLKGMTLFQTTVQTYRTDMWRETYQSRMLPTMQISNSYDDLSRREEGKFKR